MFSPIDTLTILNIQDIAKRILNANSIIGFSKSSNQSLAMMSTVKPLQILLFRKKKRSTFLFRVLLSQKKKVLIRCEQRQRIVLFCY